MYNQKQIIGYVGVVADFVDKSVALGWAIDDPNTPNKTANVVNASLNLAIALMRCWAMIAPEKQFAISY